VRALTTRCSTVSIRTLLDLQRLDRELVAPRKCAWLSRVALDTIVQWIAG